MDSSGPFLFMLFGGGLFIGLVAILMGFLQARRERLLTHAERMKALEMGRPVPDSPDVARIKAAMGTGTEEEPTAPLTARYARRCFGVALWVPVACRRLRLGRLLAQQQRPPLRDLGKRRPDLGHGARLRDDPRPPLVGRARRLASLVPLAERLRQAGLGRPGRAGRRGPSRLILWPSPGRRGAGKIDEEISFSARRALSESVR